MTSGLIVNIVVIAMDKGPKQTQAGCEAKTQNAEFVKYK